MSLDTACFSMYSLMSTRTSASSESKSTQASAFASSVFPTPVGPRKIKEPIGLLSSLNPLLALLIALAMAVTASSWSTTLSWSFSSRWTSFSLSCSSIFETGMPVHSDTISAISSSVRTSVKPFSSIHFFFFSSSSFWRSSIFFFRSSSSVGLFLASSSSCLILFSISLISSGVSDSSIFLLAHASSIRSIALSGRYLP